jgi:hypothetical protein
MKIIAAIKDKNDVFIPSAELPKGILTKFDGANYTIYEEGDELPIEVIIEPTQEGIKEDLQTQLQDILAQAQVLINQINSQI